mmetsp:Transcript_19520/g.36297  ORF Transcript_19520/g.36297 Transcript_19520/m.36297 type:complete len:101 (+) Transcript_19520:27-329(+)|eukprot:CAMPEP_0182499146 /NCGR_PEP_ID=MMETSP1321-20130603/7242_1 /TAXON_ID=91990 /ORGANISM="Bolidomonas sp., Strain RCC1657" /LENGTH=100 /DNA_ID=CAMNT_0024703293 /DNA_START=8 /DNA_END=310 /DNA_ORIENTATION=-
MLFARSARLASRCATIGMQRRQMTIIPQGALQFFYNNIAKSNITYIGFIVSGIIVSETMFGGVTDGIWNAKNKGKTYETVDWSVFKEDDEEEEEEDDDDE